MANEPVIIVGAGVGGLSTAIHLAAAGLPVRVYEKSPVPGGKIHEVAAGNTAVDGGPTVFTMRWVFEELFAAADRNLDDYLTTRTAGLLARHAWLDGATLDLFADRQASVEAIGEFAGPREAEAFVAFSEDAARIYGTLKDTFIAASRPSVFELTRRIGFSKVNRLRGIKPFSKMWDALAGHFEDPRLRQLFGRYATYCGSSPYQAPATLMLVAHVEGEGVWLVDGGMISIADALAACARDLGVETIFGENIREISCSGGRATGIVTAGGERVAASAVVFNGDPGAIAGGGLGADVSRAVNGTARKHRSLSAMTWVLQADTSGFPLARHNVFFSDDYAGEFADICDNERLPQTPTVYVCAQDRDDRGNRLTSGPERLMCLVNAPATGGRHALQPTEIEQCEETMWKRLRRAGLVLDTDLRQRHLKTPMDFAAMFPGSDGALYGPASHGWAASFRRPGSRTRLPGLYLAGGAVHPGPGVPMAALSGRLAAEALVADRTSR